MIAPGVKSLSRSELRSEIFVTRGGKNKVGRWLCRVVSQGVVNVSLILQTIEK